MVTTIYEVDGLAINTNDLVGLYHVFIFGCKPKSFSRIADVEQYVYGKTGQVIVLESEASNGTEAQTETTGAGE